MLYVLVSNSVYHYSRQPHSLKIGPQPHAPTTHAYKYIIGHFLGDISSLNICDGFEHLPHRPCSDNLLNISHTTQVGK